MNYSVEDTTNVPGSDAAILRDSINGDILVIRSLNKLVKVSVKDIILHINSLEDLKRQPEVRENPLES